MEDKPTVKPINGDDLVIPPIDHKNMKITKITLSNKDRVIADTDADGKTIKATFEKNGKVSIDVNPDPPE